MPSANYTTDMKEHLILWISWEKKAFEPRWKTSSQLDACRALFWILSRFSIHETPDDLSWRARVLGADVTDRTAVERWSGCRRGLWVIRLQMSVTQKTMPEKGKWMSVCLCMHREETWCVASLKSIFCIKNTNRTTCWHFIEEWRYFSGGTYICKCAVNTLNKRNCM